MVMGFAEYRADKAEGRYIPRLIRIPAKYLGSYIKRLRKFFD